VGSERLKNAHGRFSWNDVASGEKSKLLSKSQRGTALTFIFVCLSQAPDNASQGLFAINFGQKIGQFNV
jgi:hypothetical protein